jgi:hypothetical protein
MSNEAEDLYSLYIQFVQTNNAWWSDIEGDPLSIFLAIILSREAFPAWRDDKQSDGITSLWFSGADGDPSSLFTEAGARWLWSWVKDDKVEGIYGAISNSADKVAMVFNWLADAMQSANNLSLDTLSDYGNFWNSNFVGVAGEILNPTDAAWSKGDGMGSWGNAYMYNAQGRILLASNNL